MNSNHSNNPSTLGYEVNDIYGHSKVNMICFMDVPLLESTYRESLVGCNLQNKK